MLEKYTLTTDVHRFGITKRIVSVIVICLVAIAITALSGCSNTHKISSNDRQQVVMRTPSVEQCVEEESSSADSNYGPGTYIEIPDPCDGYPVMKDAPCTADFEPVRTSAIKLEVQLPADNSAGVFEWSVK